MDQESPAEVLPVCLGHVPISTYVGSIGYSRWSGLQRVSWNAMCSVTRQGAQSLARAWPRTLQTADGCIKLPLLS